MLATLSFGEFCGRFCDFGYGGERVHNLVRERITIRYCYVGYNIRNIALPHLFSSHGDYNLNSIQSDT